MYLVVIGWIYVVLMMSVAEATSSDGTLLGALITFVLYGVGPLSLVVYLMGAPARSKAIKMREAQALQTYQAANPSASVPSVQPDASGHAPRGAEAVAQDTSIAPVREKP
ncbi:hypothetical protein AwPolaro_00590 [Polaromonas sp.]|nr:hypothetical protein AwPolaro_00590 [Polaromonas sp.]